MRRASILICLLLGLALPAAALAHGDEPHGVAAARSLRDVAKQCASYSPRQEAHLHRVEALVLGPEHAAEHARERSEDRRKACTPSGKVRPAFARQLRAKASAKREAAVGPAASVGQWSAGIPLPGIVAIHSTLMPTGKVLFFYNNPSFGDEELGRVMVWDPVTKTGVRRDVPANIWCAGQTLLADGRLLVVGGNLQYQTDTTAFKGLNQIWIFDPWTETWTRGPNMRHGRWYPTATRMADGRVLITAGWDESGGGASANNRDIEVYTPAADGTGPGTVQLVGSEDIDYYPHQFQLPDGRVLIAGPRIDDTFYVNRDQNYALSDAPDLKRDRAYGFSAGVLLPGPPSGSSTVMLIGGGGQDAQGGNVADGLTETTESFNAAQPGATWQLRAPLPQPRRNVNGVITPDGDIIAVGGNTQGASNGYQEESLLYDPNANSWTPLASQGEPRGYHSTALLLPDASVLSAGDDTDPGGGPSNDVAEIFTPPYLFRGARPAIASAPDSVGYGQPFTIGSPSQVSRAVLMAPSAVTHGNDMNQRHVELAISPSAVGVVAASPPSPNVAPPGPYLLFLLNAQGIPSAARWIWVGVPAPAAARTGGGGAAPGGPAAGARISPPKVKRLRVGVTFAGRAATVRFVLRTSAAFRGTLGLYPVGKGKKAKALKRALVSKRIAGKGGRNVVLTARFSTTGKRFPLKLRMFMRLRDPRGGGDRVITRSLLLRRSPPSARFLG